MKTGYVYVWEFQVAAGMEAEFVAHYAPSGSWARLFRQSADYVETLLLRDHAVPGRYLTVDRWKTAAAHDAFRAAFGEQYARLDRECERLTTSERALGTYDEWPAAAAATLREGNE
jgi:hypothetical protein